MNDENREQIAIMARRVAMDCEALAGACGSLSESCVDVAMADVDHAMRKLVQAWQDAQPWTHEKFDWDPTEEGL